MKAVLVLAVVVLAACAPPYLVRAGWEEAGILARREPIERVIRDPRTPDEWRGKLRLVLDARAFAADSLALNAGDSYTTFSRLDSDTLALVLSAARKDRFEPVTWKFPIVGRVPYKGFFREDDARRAIAELRERGFDTYLRPTSAFSTLGWFADPLVSPLLRYDSVSLANTVIHELLHNTFYAAGEAQFNESFANFVGAHGAIDFFCGRDPGGSHCREARDDWADQRRFGAFLDGLVGELEALYGRPELSSAQKVAARERIFQGARERFVREVRPRLRTASFRGWDRAPLNNATLISRRLYYHRLELFERVWEREGEDLPRTVGVIAAAARGVADPYGATERLLRQPEAGL